MLLEYLDRVEEGLSLEDERQVMCQGVRCEIDEGDFTPRELWDIRMREAGLDGHGLLHEYGQPTIGWGRPDDPLDVSVIIPTYNMERFLRPAIESVLKSGEYADMEVICVNDGSTDGSLDIMRALAEEDSRIVVIDKENSGYGASVNRGLDVARGAYVTIMEPDDWVDPGMYDELFRIATDTEEVTGDLPDIVKSSYWRILGSGTGHERRIHCSYYDRLPDSDVPFRIQDEPHLVMHHPSIWSALYRKAFLDEHGIRMMEAPGAGWVDNPWLYETMCQADSIMYTNRAWYCYREDLAGSSSRGDVMLLSIERWNNMMDILDRIGVADSGVRASLHVIGFRYIQDIIGRNGLSIPEVKDGVDGMLRRMDLSVVANLENMSPGLRGRAFEVQGRSVPELPKAPYRMMLVREFGKTIQTDGIGTAVDKVRMKFGR